MYSNQIYIPIPHRHPMLQVNSMQFRYPTQSFGITPFAFHPNFQQRIIVTKPSDDPRPVCVEGQYCEIFSEKHNSKLWHPPRKEPPVVVKKVSPAPPDGETRPACVNGVECVIHSKAHHSKLWHPPIPCKFGDKCKFHEKNECVYTH
jgi:hypothetical protein